MLSLFNAAIFGALADDPRRSLVRATIEQPMLVNGAPSATGIISIEQPMIVESTPSYSSAFSPISLGNMLLWVDFIDPTKYVRVADTLTSYQNQVSGVVLTPGTPVPFEETGWNGHPCIHPLLIGHAPISTEAAVVSAFDCPSPTAKPYTIYAVVQYDSATGSGNCFAVGNSGVSSSSTRYWGLRPGVAQYEHVNVAPAANSTQVRSTAAATTNQTILCWHSSGVGCTFRINNGAADPANVTADPRYSSGVGPNRYQVGGRPDSAPDGPLPGRLAGLYIFAEDHDSTKRTQMHDWMTPRFAA